MFKGVVITSVVGCSQSSEAFLTRRIPDLKLDHITFVLYSLQFEINSDRVEKVFIELVICVPQEQARFAYSTIANDQHFEQVVAIKE